MDHSSNITGIETKPDPVGLLGMEAFQTVANQGKEGMQRQGRSSQETIVQPGSTSRDTGNNSLELFTELKPPTKQDLSILHKRDHRR